MSRRLSLRHGLPYGWWRTREFWEGVAVVVVWGASCLILALLLAVWAGAFRP